MAEIREVVSSVSSGGVALVCHEKMLDHFPPENHIAQETPQRLSEIMKELQKSKIIDRCQLFRASSAKSEDLLRVHGPDHVNKVMTLSSTLPANVKASLYKPDGEIYFSTGTTDAILLAAGAAVDACNLVIEGSFMYSFAIVRPPGHHASMDGGPKGFCYVNNIAIAVKHAIEHHHKKRILVVDWDIHHGDGTQNIFYGDERVLFFSIHRFHEDFFPGTQDGALANIGDGDGSGFNVNVCWAHSGIRDPDYVSVWEYLLIPLVREFDPEVIFISAGFDAVANDLGQCALTPHCYAYLLRKLMQYPIVMVLEGGYQTRAHFKSFWKCFDETIPDSVTCNSQQPVPRLLQELED